MTPEELDKIESLVKAATPGPWMLTGDSTLVNVTHTTRDVWTFPRTEADMVYLSGLLDAAPALIAAARDLAWHEDRHGTRAEQEAEDAVLDADLARIDALSDEECKAELAAEGIDYDAARKKLDVTIKLCAERADLNREVERLRAQVEADRSLRRIAANIADMPASDDPPPWDSICEAHIAPMRAEIERLRAFVPRWERSGANWRLYTGVALIGEIDGMGFGWARVGVGSVLCYSPVNGRPDVTEAARAVCARLGISDVGVPDV